MIPKSLKREQIHRLLEEAKKTSERDWLMILVAYLHGLRASEVVGPKGLKGRSIADGFLTAVRLKGSETTVQPLLANADPLLDERKALIDLAAKSNARQRLFPLSRFQFFRALRRHAKAAGIPLHLAHPHVLKHSCATHALEAGVPLPIVQAWLGHASGASTMRYMGASEDQVNRAITQAFAEQQPASDR